jgi:hypothetical protein
MLPYETSRSGEIPTNVAMTMQPTSELKISKLATWPSCMKKKMSIFTALNWMLGGEDPTESQKSPRTWGLIDWQNSM